MREETLQRVAQYANRVLLDESRVVTANEIKQAIGGGTDQVRAAYAAWTAELAERLRKVECLPDLPPALSNALVSAWREAVEEAQRQAKAALAEHEQQANERVAEAEQQIIALRAALAEKESEVDALSLRLDERDAAYRALETDLAEARANVQAERARAQELQQRAAHANEQAQTQISALREQLDTAYQRSDAQEQRYVALLDEQKTARNKLEQRLAETEAAAREVEKQLQTQCLTLAGTNARLSAELSVATKQAEELGQRLAKSETVRHDVEVSSSILREKFEVSQASYAEIYASHRAQQETIAQLKAEFASLQAEKEVWAKLVENSEDKPI